MFTGIVHSKRPIVAANIGDTFGTIGVDLGEELCAGLVEGASVSLDGVCLTVTRVDAPLAEFDVVASTIERTNLRKARVGSAVNVERSLAAGAENGGHDVSGHVDFTGSVARIERNQNNFCLHVSIPAFWMRYIFPRGFIALNGVSLTVSDVDKQQNRFTIWLIPETLRRTNLNELEPGDPINVEIHRGVQVIVDTVETAIERFLTRALGDGVLDMENIREMGLTTLKLLSASMQPARPEPPPDTGDRKGTESTG